MNMKNEVSIENAIEMLKVHAEFVKLVGRAVENALDSRNCLMTTYDKVKTGNLIQQTRWDSTQHKSVEVFDDNGEPVMVDEYEYKDREKTSDELTSDEKIQLKAYEEFFKKMTALI